MTKQVKGDLLQATENIIGHQVNCQGTMGAGLAAKIRNKYPIVFEKYKGLVNKFSDNKEMLLGTAQIIKVDENKYVANLFGQFYYGRGERHTDYKSLYQALETLKQKAKKHNLTVALPYGLGCVLAGGDWNIVRELINKAFEDYEVTIYKFD
ncbi:macro domain-containing protein [Anoxybacillus flavithermus]|uniref:macro domain-containing protein n=1 Tax=Anoxybacillus flavithermus TaxID=33934 RepID=UPI001866FDEF|nr:macro domain-containing protein [Anoxybacillus flavithermus]MBE2918335.1 macro domain-containing protein [Anoxybacillus flavithermus]